MTDGHEVIERWKQLFDQHLNRANDDANAAEDENEPTPTLREVKDGIHQLNTNKTAGKDGITAELIKMGPEKLATCLHRLIVRIWETVLVPEEWKEEVICPIRKEGDHLECENCLSCLFFNIALEGVM